MGRPKSFKREEIVQQVMEIFWLKGYAATSLSDLTEATGLNKKSLYNEFGPKQELFRISLETYKNQKNHQIDILLKAPLGKNNIISYLEDLAASSNKKGCLFSLSIYERELLEEKEKKEVNKNFEGLQSLILKNLKVEYGAKKAQALSLLVSSIMFSVAGLGKLNVDKKQINSMILELISMLKKT